MSELSTHLHLSKAKTVEEIRFVCRPKPLVGRELDAFFVETDKSRDPHQNTRAKLIRTLNMGENMRILFYGHRGSGKSTEINKFLAEQGDAFFPVNFSVLEEMSAVAARAEDLILVITDRVLHAANEAKLKVDMSLLKGVLGYFSETMKATTRSRDSSLLAGAGISTESTPWGKLLGLFANLKAEIKLAAHSEETTVAHLRKRPADLLMQANLVINPSSAVRGVFGLCLRSKSLFSGC